MATLRRFVSAFRLLPSCHTTHCHFVGFVFVTASIFNLPLLVCSGLRTVFKADVAVKDDKSGMGKET
jgi:hypothetical protein